MPWYKLISDWIIHIRLIFNNYWMRFVICGIDQGRGMRYNAYPVIILHISKTEFK
jgi:hypothetical protein